MVIATGFFDGVHLGHQKVIDQLIYESKKRGTESTIVTFWPHPRNVLQKGARELRLLNSLEEKLSLLRQTGIDNIEVLDFTKEFSTLSTEAYIKDYLIKKFGAKAILLGYDNRFGKKDETNDDIEEIAKRLGLEVIVADNMPIPTNIPAGVDLTSPYSNDNISISSTKIRNCLIQGEVDFAQKMLGYHYFLKGVIVAGQKLGRTIGFPTANMELFEPRKLIPADGVYLVKVETIGKEFWGMCNIGLRPTVSRGELRTIETNIFDFDEDIYGLDMRISFVKAIRKEKKFCNLDQLKAQLNLDKRTCLSLVTD